MEIGMKTDDSALAILDRWYESIHNDDQAASAEYAQQAQALAGNLSNSKEQLYLKLLTFRHNILIKDFTTSRTLAAEIEPLIDEADQEFYFLYHLFLGTYHFNVNDYTESLHSYQKAEEVINPFTNTFHQAELYHRIGIAFYHTRKTFTAIHYTTKAEKIYNSDSKYGKQATWCSVLLGLCCISMKNFADAEVYFLEALDQAKKINSAELITNIRFNLGFLYSEQSLSRVSIRHLEHVLEDHFYEQKTTFLLAREHYKLGEKTTAQDYIEQGLEICHKLNDSEYIYHLNILNELNSNASTESLQTVVVNAINYFKQKNLWGPIQDYCEMLGKTLFQSKTGKIKASEFYHLAYEAKQNLI